MPFEGPISGTADTIPSSASGAREERDSIELARGASVGRYLVLGKLGAGGMGVVYSAFDPELDRRVALKALHSSSGDRARDTEGRSRLIREAKAMARLSHPHVVTVYDVLADGEKIFVAMELVEGQTLRAWLEAQKRSWREVVGVFVQAGRGLAAAHDASIVHRDFKLDNVFVGNDGRVRVGDFGLARSGTAPARGHRRTKKDDLGPLVSREGMLAGTPAYMAPDQLRGDPADARSDQFSFCAALYEGLYGDVPFSADSLEVLVETMEEDRVRPPPPNVGVPAWLRAIVERGLRSRPPERFESMHALLSALEADPRQSWKRRAVVGVAALLGISALGAAAYHRHEGDLACGALERRLDGVWGDAERAAVREAFVATGRPYALDTFERAVRALDAYATDWGRAEVGGCREQKGEASLPLRKERSQCLDDRLADLRAFTGVLRRAEGVTVDRAVQGARALPSIEACAGNDPLGGAVWPSDPVVRREAEALEDRMRLVGALRIAGRAGEAMPLARENVSEAERIGFRPLRADALLAAAEVGEDAGEIKEAETNFHAASVAAEGVGAARVAARAWLGAARRASDRGDYPVADERFDHAGAWVERAPNDDALRATLLHQRGRRLTDDGKYDEAREVEKKALALFEKAKSDEVLDALNGLGVAADLQGKYDEAKGYYQRVLEGYEHLLGPDHPKVANELNNLGLMAADQGKWDESVAALSRALAVRERASGPEHPEVAAALSNLAMVYDGMDRYADALPLAERAVAICEKNTPDGPNMGYALAALSSALIGLRRPADAIPPAERELAIRLKGGAEVYVADARCDLGMALVDSGRDVPRGRELLQKARAGYLSSGRTLRIKDVDARLADSEPRKK
ncbi:MAG TPA: serine/threonine-protein kinase [Polyangiaceae bacterium]